MAHTFTHLVTHLVLGTKDRARTLTPSIKEELHAYMGGIVRQEGGKAIIVNGMEDHVHLGRVCKSQPKENGGNCQHRFVVLAPLLVAGCNPTELLEAVEQPLHDIA